MSLIQDDSLLKLHGHVVWLVDPSSNLCLSADGFTTCGDTNLFKIHTSSRADSLQLELILPPSQDNYQESSSYCLSRDRIYQNLRLHPCDHHQILSSTRWTYDIIEGKLSTRSSFLSHRCLVNENNKGVLHSCFRGFTELRPVFHTLRSPSTVSLPTSNSQDISPSSSEWICPHTGLHLPLHLKDNKDSDFNSQSFVGGGIYTKQAFGMLFKVFSLAWYIDKEKASQDSTLSYYRNHEDHLSSEFYDALISPHAHYDRSILVKMAMSVKRDMLIEGLVQDLNMKPENSELIAQAGQHFKSANCERGLEILFTWRAATESSSERFEIRVNGKKITSITKPGIGEDFFSKFVSSEPVSPILKQQLSERFDVFDIQQQESKDTSDLPRDLYTYSAATECRTWVEWLKCLRRIRVKRPSVMEEVYASMFVLFYSILLITQSLPSKIKLLKVVKFREKLSSLKSKLSFSAGHLKSKMSHSAGQLARSISFHRPGSGHYVVKSEVDSIIFVGY